MSRKDDHLAHQRAAITRLRDERDAARKETETVRQRIENLALEHQPEMLLTYGASSLPVVREDRGPGQLDSVFERDLVDMRCRAKTCPFAWPCPTYLWATNSLPFVVKIEPKTKP